MKELPERSRREIRKNRGKYSVKVIMFRDVFGDSSMFIYDWIRDCVPAVINEEWGGQEEKREFKAV